MDEEENYKRVGEDTYLIHGYLFNFEEMTLWSRDMSLSYNIAFNEWGGVRAMRFGFFISDVFAGVEAKFNRVMMEAYREWSFEKEILG